ncbi:MAG: HipA domain-containing protein, partial [Raoultibacter sp.]
IPNLDYHQLMRLTLFLTNSYDEIMKLFRLMCFNVYAHNRDDHAKNFSYLYDGEACAWKLSPAYDLTYSSSLRGEHATTVNGEGANPTLDDLLAVATRAGIAKSSAQEAALEIKEKTLPLRKH